MTKKEKIQDFIENYIVLIPVILAIAVIPLIVRVTFYDPGLSIYPWFADSSSVFDMFMYYKNQAMIQLDALLVVAYIYLWTQKKLPMDLHFMPIVAYVILLALSAIFSIAPYQTWYGFYGMLETVYALFGYCMICYYAFAVINSEKKLKIVAVAFVIGFAVLALIGASQFFGFDFYMTELGQNLIIPSEHSATGGNLKLTFNEGIVYGSLFNPNYVGVYCCMLCPLLLVFAFSTSKKWQVIASLIALVLMQICFVGAGSKTTLLLMGPFMLFIAVCYAKKHAKQMTFVYVFFIAMFLLIDQYEIKGTHLVDKTIASIKQESNVMNKDKITDITLGDTEFYVSYKDEVFQVSYQKDENNHIQLIVKDKEGNAVPLIYEEGEKENLYRFEDEAYKQLYFVPGENVHGNQGFTLRKGSARFFIYYSEKNQTYLYTNQFGRSTKLYTSESYESPVFAIMGGFSNRAFIWSKSIPLLKDTLLIGTGPDTYAFMFPQYDYVALNQNGMMGTLLTKPHSMYLQMGVQTGVLSVIVFLIFYVWYFIDSFKLYRGRKLESFTERCGAAVYMATVGYMCAGLLHDSTIGTSIVYWTLMGIGLACNRMLTHSDDKI